MEELGVCMSERLQPDLLARIIRCKAQNGRSDLTFSLLFILESTFIPPPIIYLRIFRLTKFRTDESLDHFYADVACKSGGLLSEPTLPRKRRTLVRLEVGAGAPSLSLIHI